MGERTILTPTINKIARASLDSRNERRKKVMGKGVSYCGFSDPIIDPVVPEEIPNLLHCQLTSGYNLTRASRTSFQGLAPYWLRGNAIGLISTPIHANMAVRSIRWFGFHDPDPFAVRSGSQG